MIQKMMNNQNKINKTLKINHLQINKYNNKHNTSNKIPTPLLIKHKV